MSIVRLLVCVFFLAANSLVSAYSYPESCPRIKPMEFERTKMTGTWYEFTHSKDSGYSCSVYNQQFVDVSDEPHQLAIINSETRYDNGSIISDKEYFRIPPSLEGKYPKHAPDGREIFTYYILDTDYTSYFVGYYCGFEDYFSGVGQEVFFASRDKEFPAGHMEKMIAVLERNGISHPIESKPEGCEGLKLPKESEVSF